MLSVLNDSAAIGTDSIRFGPSAYGVERAEVHLSARGFVPHRHDTYGIGVTTAGVQSSATAARNNFAQRFTDSCRRQYDKPMLSVLNDSAARGTDSIRFGPSAYGVERAEVHLSARGFDPHRHDTYGIGVTTAGVQIFRYRGAQRVCLPGQLHVLHPDETHDGGPGTEAGFGYRILYVQPELVRGALGGRALPFVADPVQEPQPMARPIVALLADIDDPISELSCAEIAVAVADYLVSLTDRRDRGRAKVDIRAVELVREYLAAHAREQTPASTLEKIAGTDRFTITRHFRWAFGTSPDRYRTLRRLGLAQAAIESGQSLVQVAAEAGFADQSHMSRQFKRTYGLTPTRWRALTAASSTERLETFGRLAKSP